MSKDKKDKDEDWYKCEKIGDWFPLIIVWVVGATLYFSLPDDEVENAMIWCFVFGLLALFWLKFIEKFRGRNLDENGKEDFKIFFKRLWFYLCMIFLPLVPLMLSLFAGYMSRTSGEIYVGIYFAFLIFGVPAIAKIIYPYSYDKEKDKKE